MVRRVRPASWVAALLGGHAWYLGLFSQQAQQDVWGENPGARAASSLAATGKVERVSDGFRLTGRWRFLSGVDHAQWILLGGVIPDEGDGPEFRAFLLPASDYEIDQDSWRVAGLQGSGSKDVTVDAVVPEYRTLTVDALYHHTEPGKAVNTGPIFDLPWMSMWAYNIASCAIGAATGALDAFIDDNRRRVSAVTGAAATQNAALHTRLAEAVTLVRDARARIRAPGTPSTPTSSREGRFPGRRASRPGSRPHTPSPSASPRSTRSSRSAVVACSAATSCSSTTCAT